MPYYDATPFAMTTEFFSGAGGLAGLTGEYGELMSSNYSERQTVQVEGKTPKAAAEQVWEIFQNIDDDHLTPDDGRSLMVGDLVRLRENGTDTWLQVATFGFKVVAPPTTG